MNTKVGKEEDDEIEIEIVDDVPEGKKPRLTDDDGKPAKRASSDDDGDDDGDDDDLEGYSEKVKKRLNKLTFKYREAERQREEAARMRDEAVNYAKTVYSENEALRQNVQRGQSATLEQAKARAQSELKQAKAAFRAAYETGDPDALVEAQEVLSKAQADSYRLENYRPRPQQQRTAPQQQQPALQAPELTPLQKEWAADNPWFGKNKEMTGFAYGVHESLVESGIDPNTRTYYARIDEAVKKRFADEFDDGYETVEVATPSKKTPATVVAPAQRSVKQPRKIVLTSTQVALAKRMGVPPEKYAAQLLKDAKNG